MGLEGITVAQVATRFVARLFLMTLTLLLAACSTTTVVATTGDTADNSSDPAVTSATAATSFSNTSSSDTSSSSVSAAPSAIQPPATAAPAAAVDPLPFPVQADGSSQLITVAAAAAGSTDIILTGWDRDPDGNWVAAIGPVAGVVGTDGIGTASETTSFTPAGTFPLTRAFGINPNPGSGVLYQQVDLSDWWVSDVNSLQYNTLQSCNESDCPFDTAVSEHLARITPEYAYAVVIDYNTAPAIAGAGSAFFLHVSRGIPTQGCVAIDSATLVQILKWLDPADNPVIGIGLS